MFADVLNSVNAGRVVWKRHALERMMERRISRIEVKQVILLGNIIEYYPDDYPIPNLILATLQPEPLHVVVAYDSISQQCHVITAYRPDLIYFEADLITRRLV
ncbi:MAG: DUF4258 domain-containing protein [Methylococcales bacterium]|nr:DUF4258 domain-containing protein [Methylococcales bacterium]